MGTNNPTRRVLQLDDLMPGCWYWFTWVERATIQNVSQGELLAFNGFNLGSVRPRKGFWLHAHNEVGQCRMLWSREIVEIQKANECEE